MSPKNQGGIGEMQLSIPECTTPEMGKSVPHRKGGHIMAIDKNETNVSPKEKLHFFDPYSGRTSDTALWGNQGQVWGNHGCSKKKE